MKETPAVPLVHLVALAGGLVVVAIAVRGISAAIRVALEELDYRAGDLESWFRGLT